jgi:hypothetical protein
LQLDGHEHVLQGGECGDQLETLEDEAYLFGANGGALVLGQLGQVLPVQLDVAGRRQIEPGEQAEQRRLPGA